MYQRRWSQRGRAARSRSGADHSSAKEKLSFPTLLATPDVAGVYNIVYRYLFDRRRDLGSANVFPHRSGRHDR